MLDPGIVSRRDRIESKAFRIIEECLELDLLIAEDVRIRRTPLAVFIQKDRKHIIPILLDEVDAKQGQAKALRHGLCVRIILFLRTDIILNGRIAFDVIIGKRIPVPHESAGDLMSLLFQHISSDGRIYSSR